MMSIRKTLWTLFLVGALLGLITCTSGTDPISDGGNQNTGDPVPFIGNITPQAGPAAGGTLVTITGTSLTADTQILIGGTVLANLQFLTTTTMRGTTPPPRCPRRLRRSRPG